MHINYHFLLLYWHIKKLYINIGKEKIMFFKSLIATLQSSYTAFNDNGYDNVDPNIVKYFRTEFGADWQAALEHHLYEKTIKNDKKAA